MGVNKVVYGTDTLIDLTEDTVTEDTLLEGITAHNAAGDPIVGRVSLDPEEVKEFPEKSIEELNKDEDFFILEGSDGPFKMKVSDIIEEILKQAAEDLVKEE